MTPKQLLIEHVLKTDELIQPLISYHRDEPGKLIELFSVFRPISKPELDEMIEDGEFTDFHPFFSKIAYGEYGNCILTLYREKFYDDYLKNPCPYINEANKDELHREILQTTIDNRLNVYGHYAYQYKGMMQELWFIGTLKETVELNVD